MRHRSPALVGLFLPVYADIPGAAKSNPYNYLLFLNNRLEILCEIEIL